MAKIFDKKRGLTNKRKIYCAKHLIDFRNRNPEKYKAQQLVSNYYRKHKSEKPTICFLTGETPKKIHLHHFDYTKPNEVIPCTPQIHSDFHQGKILDIKDEWILKLNF